MLTSSQITLNPGAHLEFVNNTGGYDVYTVYVHRILLLTKYTYTINFINNASLTVCNSGFLWYIIRWLLS